MMTSDTTTTIKPIITSGNAELIPSSNNPVSEPNREVNSPVLVTSKKAISCRTIDWYNRFRVRATIRTPAVPMMDDRMY